MLYDEINGNQVSTYDDHPSLESPSLGMSTGERQYQLRNASEKYLNGQISDKELEEVEEALGIDYEKTSLGLASISEEILAALRGMLCSLRKGLSRDDSSENLSYEDKGSNTTDNL